MTEEIPKPSDHFMEALINSGSLVIDCELCGRTHFCTYETGSYEVDELEHLQEMAKKEPDKYIEWNDASSISWGRFDNKQVVYDCPCNQASKYEQFVWSHRYIIMKYLKSRSESMKNDADDMVKKVEEVKLE